jgi:autophagy-related protein 101
VPWEVWQINTTLRQPTSEREREQLYAELSAALARAVMDILEYTSSERGRTAVPLIASAEGISPFPWEIKLKVDGADVVV